jgi:hypothetical protein
MEMWQSGKVGWGKKKRKGLQIMDGEKEGARGMSVNDAREQK